jgi:hypothetical protein
MAGVLKGFITLLACLVLLPAASGSAAAHPAGSVGTLLQALFDPRLAADDYFGYSAAVSGSVAVVGAPTFNGSGPGNAYIYVKGATGWPRHPTATLPDPAAANGDAFGTSVAIGAGAIIVGAPGTASGTGAAYLYVMGTGGWPTAPTVTLADPGHAAGDGFGRSVALAGTTAVVGAPAGQNSPGTAYLYVMGTAGWPAAPTTALADPGHAAGDSFGRSVSVAGTTAVIGAYGTASFAGAAYVYLKGASGWPAVPAVTLHNPRPARQSFGFAVAVSGTAVVVGGPTPGMPGIAYIYAKGASGWPAKPTVTLTDNVTGAADFGAAVAVSGSVAIVGAPGTFNLTGVAGGAFFYVKGGSGWPAAPTAAVALSSHAGAQDFGAAVAVSGPTAVIGSFGADQAGGKAYIYQA